MNKTARDIISSQKKEELFLPSKETLHEKHSQKKKYIIQNNCCLLSLFLLLNRSAQNELPVWTPNNRLPTNRSSSHSKTIEFRWILLHFNGKQATNETNVRMNEPTNEQHKLCVRLTYTCLLF